MGCLFDLFKGAEGYKDELDFKHLKWSPYDELKYRENEKKAQVNGLFYTGLVEPNNGIEFTLSPLLICLDLNFIYLSYTISLKL